MLRNRLMHFFKAKLRSVSIFYILKIWEHWLVYYITHTVMVCILYVFNQEIFKLFKNLKSVIIYYGEYSTDYKIDVESLYGLFDIYRDVKMMLKAHNPG